MDCIFLARRPEEVTQTFYSTFEVALLVDSAHRAWFRKGAFELHHR